MARKGGGSFWRELQQGDWANVEDTKRVTSYGSSAAAIDPRMRGAGDVAQPVGPNPTPHSSLEKTRS